MGASFGVAANNGSSAIDARMPTKGRIQYSVSDAPLNAAMRTALFPHHAGGPNNISIDELAARSAEKGGALVMKLPRAAGAREARWAQLLCGAVDASAFAVPAQAEDFVAASELAALKAQQAATQAELAELRALVERLYAELGVQRS